MTAPDFGTAAGFVEALTPMSGGCVWMLVVTDDSEPKKPVRRVDHMLFADESNTHAEAIATVVAGYLATPKRWEAFNKPYVKVHRAARLRNDKPFHMTDFMKSDPPHERYAHLKPHEREALLNGVVGAICNTQKTGFIAAVLQRDYRAVLPEDLRNRLRHPRIFLIQLLTKIVASWAPDHLPPGDKIAFVFERVKGTDPEVHAAYQEIANPVHDPGGYLLSGCWIANKTEALEFVAADLLANCSGRFLGTPDLRTTADDEPALWRLENNPQVHHHYKLYTRELLQETVRDMTERGFLPLKPEP